ncbi:TPA: DUF551 domain-containing protein [Klebsiella aerogenes]|nr:DUF551 domain-containing protein [Klebsiella aerogenes]
MTKSTITRERAEQLANFKGAPVTRQEEQELARIALAAMDSEPVGYFGRFDPDDEDLIDQCSKNVKGAFPLYLHAQPALVVSADLLHTAASAIEDLLTTKDRTGARVWFDLPFRLRSVANAQPAPVVQCPFPCGWDNLNKLAIQDAAFIACGLVEGEPITEAHRQAAISNNDRLLKVISACRAAMLQAEPVTTANKLGNSPVIPDTWIPVSERMPEDEVDVQIYCPGSKEQMVGYLERNEQEGYFRYATWRTGDGIYCQPSHWMPLPSAPQEVGDA